MGNTWPPFVWVGSQCARNGRWMTGNRIGLRLAIHKSTSAGYDMAKGLYALPSGRGSSPDPVCCYDQRCNSSALSFHIRRMCMLYSFQSEETPRHDKFGSGT